MSVVKSTGAPAVPGDIIYRTDTKAVAAKRRRTEEGEEAVAEADSVTAGEGCYCRLVAAQGGAERHFVSSRVGIVQWNGNAISVYPRGRDATSGAAAVSLVLGPLPGDKVHVRILRVSRSFALGDIVAVNGQWCASRNALNSSAFRGVLQTEDIRPFKPTKDQITPPAPALSFQSGDVVVAEVISQSDVRQYQLSTHAEHCGVVESHVVNAGGQTVRLQHVSGRRDIMKDPSDNSVVPRWCPLLTL